MSSKDLQKFKTAIVSGFYTSPTLPGKIRFVLTHFEDGIGKMAYDKIQEDIHISQLATLLIFKIKGENYKIEDTEYNSSEELIKFVCKSSDYSLYEFHRTDL